MRPCKVPWKSEDAVPGEPVLENRESVGSGRNKRQARTLPRSPRQLQAVLAQLLQGLSLLSWKGQEEPSKKRLRSLRFDVELDDIRERRELAKMVAD